MRDRVVRVVTPGSSVAEWASTLALYPAASQRPVGAVGFLGLRLEQVDHNLLRKRMPPPARVTPSCPGRDLEVFGPEVDNIVLRRKVAQRIKELTAYHVRGRAQFRGPRGIELQQVTILASVFDHKTRRNTVAFGADHGPDALGVGRCAIAGSALEFGNRHPPKGMPVRVPGAIRDLALCVHVERWPRRVFSRLAFPMRCHIGTLQEVVQIVYGPDLHLAYGSRRWFSPKWIIRVELLTGAVRRCRLRQRREYRDCGQAESPRPA